MPSADLLIAFFAATLIFGYMPGPALLYAAARTISGGRRAGFQAALGLHVGGYLHVIAAAIGLALLFRAIPSLYIVIKFLGAAYLIWLGIKLWRSDDKTHANATTVSSASPAFFQSATVEMLNPKTALFYLAFLPQFTDATAAFPIWLQLLILGTIVNVVFSSADIVCVFLADKIVTLMRRSKTAGNWARRVGGSILIGLGLHIAFSETKA